MPNIYDRPITDIKGIGESKRNLFNSIGIYTINDLLNYFPRDYEDRRNVINLNELKEDMFCSFKGIIASKVTNLRIRKNLSIQKVKVNNETGSVTCVWYNRPYLKNSLFFGQEYSFYGKAQKNRGTLEIQNPEFERVKEEGNDFANIMPIYPLVSGISQGMIRKTVKTALKMCEGCFNETLPEKIRSDYGLVGINYAMQNIHYPGSLEEQNDARYRLVFEELLLFQLALLSIREKNKIKDNYIKYKYVPEVYQLIDSLPFKLTDAQMRALREIEDDMESEHVMNRLLQGDVGSGKTIVSVLAAVKAVKNGYQVAVMAPTEILAGQHKKTFDDVLNTFKDINVAILTGSMKKREKDEVLAGIANGEINILIGTHSLIEEDVVFKKLGLVITDEQHRFGVVQREKIIEKGSNADILVMSATPIPRTLALILYGDLDVSIIDELPVGRKPIETYCLNESMRKRINEFIRKKVSEGRQVFIVCPFIEESEDLDGQAAEILYEKLKDEIFPEFNVDILHGRMKNAQKEQTMKGFVDGETDILVSTTIIEVGVNIPNATVMVIENAERFGLAQLHQLRGRIGRGSEQSYCIMFSESKSLIARERFKIMVKTNDGFLISEKDMELRGPGDFFGTKQHGIPQLKVANLYRDMDALKETGAIAQAIVDETILTEKECEDMKRFVVDKFYNRLDNVFFS